MQAINGWTEAPGLTPITTYATRPDNLDTARFGIYFGFPEPVGVTTRKDIPPPLVNKSALWPSRPLVFSMQPGGRQSNNQSAPSLPPHLQFPPEIRLAIIQELFSGHEDTSTMTSEEMKDYFSLRLSDKLFFILLPPLKPTGIKVTQSQLHYLFSDVGEYQRVIYGSRGGGSTFFHRPYLSISVLCIHLEGAADLAALTAMACQVLPAMTMLRELQFVIRDRNPFIRFLWYIGYWFMVSGTSSRIKKIYLTDARRSYGPLFNDTQPWMDTFPFVRELSMFSELRMVSISTQGMAIPSPLPFYKSVAEMADDLRASTPSLIIPVLEMAFAKELLSACPRLKRIYFHSCADTPFPRQTGFWTNQTNGNLLVPCSEDISVIRTVRRMSEAVALERVHDYNLFAPQTDGHIWVADTGDTCGEICLNNALKQHGVAHMVRAFPR